MPPLRPFRRGAGARGPTVEEWAEEFSLIIERHVEFGQLLFGGPSAVPSGGNNHTHGTVAATNVTVTSASSGLSISVAAPGGGGGLGGVSANGGAITSGTASFVDSNGLSFGRTSQSITASHDGIRLSISTNLLYTSQSSLFQHTSATSAITSGAAASGHSHGNPTLALTNLAGTTASASNGLTISLSHNISTAAQSNHSHGNPTLALTNLSGTTASASNGLTLSLSANAPGAAAENNWVNLTGNTVGNTSASGSTIMFSGGPNITLSGTNGSVVVISAAAAGGGFSQFHQAVGYGAVGGARPLLSLLTHASAVNTRPFFMPFLVPGNLTANEIHFTVSQVNTSSNILYTLQAGIYSFVNSTSIGLISSTQVNYSVSDTASFSGVKAYEMPMPVTSLSPGYYVLGMNFSAAATGSMNFSLMGGATSNPNVTPIIQSGSNSYHTYTSHGRGLFFGRYTANSAGMPANVTVGQYIAGFTGASLALPLFADMWNHV